MKPLLITLSVDRSTHIEIDAGIISIEGVKHDQILVAAIAAIYHALREGLNINFDFADLKKAIGGYETAFDLDNP